MKRFVLVLGPTLLGTLIACSGAADIDLFAAAPDGGTSGEEDTGVEPGDDATTEDGTTTKDTGGKDTAPPIKDGSPKDTNQPDTFDANKACNVTTNSATVIPTGCESGFTPTYSGGKLTSGHYELEDIYTLGTEKECDVFVSTNHYAAIDIVADATGNLATMDIVHETGGVVTRASFTLGSPGITQTLTVNQTCPSIGGTAQWKYDTNGKGGKRFRYETTTSSGAPVIWSFLRP